MESPLAQSHLNPTSTAQGVLVSAGGKRGHRHPEAVKVVQLGGTRPGPTAHPQNHDVHICIHPLCGPPRVTQVWSAGGTGGSTFYLFIAQVCMNAGHGTHVEVTGQLV